MNCIKCGYESELVEIVRRGRRERLYWQCYKCDCKFGTRGKLIPNMRKGR